MINKSNKFFEYMKGNISKKFIFQIYLPLLMLTHYGLIFISWLLFPTDYTLFSNSISQLGIPILNPSGWFLFSLDCWVISILTIPLVIFTYHRMKAFRKNIVKLAATSYMISTIGSFIIGFFPNYDGVIIFHEIFAIITICGSIISLMLYFVVIIRDILKTKKRNHNYLIFCCILMIIIILSISIGIVISQRWLIFQGAGFMSLLFGFPFLEWLLSFVLIFESIFIMFMTPSDKKFQGKD